MIRSLIFGFLLTASALAMGQVYELSCTTGTFPLEKTVNPTTGFLRAYICIDAFGNVTSPVFGSGGVASVFGRTGAVAAVATDYSAVNNLQLGDGSNSIVFN